MNSKCLTLIYLLSFSLSLDARSSAHFQAFTYGGKSFEGEVLEVVPATVKMRDRNGRTGVFHVDKLNVEFAATLDIPNNPYKQILYSKGTVPTQNAKSDSGSITRGQPHTKGLAESPEVEKVIIMRAITSPPEMMTFALPAKRIGPLSVNVIATRVGQVDYKDRVGKVKATGLSLLTIYLDIKNESSKPVKYITWRGLHGLAAKLSDNNGLEFIQHRIQSDATFLEGVSIVEILPREKIRDVLFFRLPTEKATSFKLTLPGGNINLTSDTEFSLPARYILRK